MPLSYRTLLASLTTAALLAACAKGDDSRGPADPSAAGQSGSAGQGGSGGKAGGSQAGSGGSSAGSAGSQAGSSGGGAAGDAQGGQGGDAGSEQGGSAGAGGQGEPCNPVAQTGCKASQACFPQNTSFVCDEPGKLTEGQPCTFASECAGGNACLKLNNEVKCFRICDPADDTGCGPDDKTCCLANQRCSKVQDPYGICVPK